MKRTTTVIVGAGQAGLAMSRHLSRRGVDHVVLERGKIANSWRHERWDSLRLLTPNWQSRLPGFGYTGKDLDGYRTMPEVIRFLEDYAGHIAAPVEAETTVLSVTAEGDGYVVRTTSGDWRCRSVVAASGACNIPIVPKAAEELPVSVRTLTPFEYRNPGQLEEGGVLVVGASATGLQLAREIRETGRRVVLSAGEHVRVPRVYRGRDIKWWMDRTGILDMTWREVDDIRRARRVPSLQLAGSPGRETLDMNTLSDSGVEITGRLAGIREGTAQFSGALGNVCALADLKMNRLLDGIDLWAHEHRYDKAMRPPERFQPTRVDPAPRLALDLRREKIRTVIWATGFRPDHSWLTLPVFDRKGRIAHEGGVTALPGIYVLGLPFLRRRKSSLIDGVGADANDLADHMMGALDTMAAAA